MRVAVFVHFYVPYRNAGSETMLHAMVKELIEAGHTVQVYATVMPEAPPRYEYEGVDVLVTNIIYARQDIMSWKPDVIISTMTMCIGPRTSLPSERFRSCSSAIMTCPVFSKLWTSNQTSLFSTRNGLWRS